MALSGLLPALLSAVAFGLQYVPVKKYKIYDGTTFQWFMCSGILFVGVSVALLHGDLQYSVPPSVVMGGGIWALSNFAVLPLVKLLGIGLGFSLYHFQNMIVGYLVGRNGLFGLPRLQPAFAGSLYVCDLGCLLVLVSFVGLLLVEGRGSDSEKEKEPGPAPSVHGKGQLDQIEEQHEEEVALDRNLHQVSVLELSRAKAKAASEAATPQVLSFFDSVGFREMLKGCCTEVANLTAEELLQRYRAEAQVAELAHALPAPGESIGVFSDVTTTEVGELPWFPNEFEVALMHNRSMSEGAAPINDIAQKEIFGCKPFAGPKPTWTEASSRLIYIAHNMRRLDSGSEPFFGDLTVVFNSSRVKDSVVIAPYDTGLYTMMCLRPEMSGHHKMKKFLPHLNCSAWPVNLPVGTLDYLDHLILPNLAAPVNSSVTNRTILDTARELYTRSGMSKIDYQDVPALDLRSLGGYMDSRSAH
eukprot:g12026.t1